MWAAIDKNIEKRLRNFPKGIYWVKANFSHGRNVSFNSASFRIMAKYFTLMYRSTVRRSIMPLTINKSDLAVITYYSPLRNFISNEDEYWVTKYLRIKRNGFEIRKIDKDFHLAQWEQNQIQECSHWLITEKSPKYFTSSSEIFNTFLLAVWIYSPTKVSIGFKFGVSKSEEKYSRLHDYFQFNRVDNNRDVYSKDDLDKIKDIFQKLSRICRNGKRLYASVVYSVYASFQYNWKSSFILSSTALESLLTYGARNDVTNKLAKAFCCFTESKKYRRDIAFRKFKKIYGIRSDLVHGRFIKRDDARRNLNNLSIASTALRKMWASVLNNPFSLIELEKSDANRERHFVGHTRGYVNP